jgi:hypothetical protein
MKIRENGILKVVRPDRLERPTFWFVARRSIQLSYGRNLTYNLKLPQPISQSPSRCRYRHLIPGRRLVSALDRLALYRALRRRLQQVSLRVELVNHGQFRTVHLEREHLALDILAREREPDLRRQFAIAAIAKRDVNIPARRRSGPLSLIRARNNRILARDHPGHE